MPYFKEIQEANSKPDGWTTLKRQQLVAGEQTVSFEGAKAYIGAFGRHLKIVPVFAVEPARSSVTSLRLGSGAVPSLDDLSNVLDLTVQSEDGEEVLEISGREPTTRMVVIFEEGK